jgi:PBP1b-binding outer membrane lipoprotein LpoB
MKKVKFKIGLVLLSTMLLCACNNNQDQENKDKDSTNSTSEKTDASNAEVKVNPLKECLFWRPAFAYIIITRCKYDWHYGPSRRFL